MGTRIAATYMYTQVQLVDSSKVMGSHTGRSHDADNQQVQVEPTNIQIPAVTRSAKDHSSRLTQLKLELHNVQCTRTVVSKLWSEFRSVAVQVQLT